MTVQQEGKRDGREFAPEVGGVGGVFGDRVLLCADLQAGRSARLRRGEEVGLSVVRGQTDAEALADGDEGVQTCRGRMVARETRTERGCAGLAAACLVERTRKVGQLLQPRKQTGHAGTDDDGVVTAGGGRRRTVRLVWEV